MLDITKAAFDYDAPSIRFVLASLLGGIGVTYVVKTILKFRKERASLSHIPGPPYHWLFGNEIDFTDGFDKEIKWTEKFGPLLVLRMGPLINQILITGPDEARALLSTAEPKDQFIYRMLIPWMGEGLLVSNGNKWARNRKLLTPSFHFDILKSYQFLFSQSTMCMINKWKRLLKKNPADAIEVFEQVSTMTLDSLMKCIFGLNEDIQNSPSGSNPYITAVHQMAKLLWQRFLFLPYHSDLIYSMSWSGYKFRYYHQMAQSFTRSVINKKRNNAKNTMKASGKKYIDFIDMLLQCRDDEGNGLSEQEIQDEVDTFMFAGHDTTASAISWCLYNLAMHPQYQDKCRKEVLAVIGENDEVSWEDLSRLGYLTMCLKESLRTHPPVPIVGRQLTKPLTISDKYTLPAGTWCGCSIHAVHHHNDYWPDPYTYNPERFTAEKSASRHSYAFIVFSAGPRNCIGQHFAMNEVKTGLALILKHFRISADENRPAKKTLQFNLKPKNGIWLYLESLEANK